MVGLLQHPEAEHGQYLTHVFDQHRGPLLRYVRRLLPDDPHRAEDVVQETLLRAWSTVDELARQPGSPRGWLFTVARNVVIDWHRRDQARPRETGEVELLTLPTRGNPVDDALTRRLVLDALAGLPPRHREVLVRLHYLDQSGAEAAATMGIPVGTVKSRVHHAVRAMRRALHTAGVTGS